MGRDVDNLTAPTLRYVRERWWDASFTSFLYGSPQPRPGDRVLDVGCGAGIAEVQLGSERLDGVLVVGVDSNLTRAVDARAITRRIGMRVCVAASDAVALSFAESVFDCPSAWRFCRICPILPRRLGSWRA